MMISITGRCPFCGNAVEISVDEGDYEAWVDEELAQNVFPSLTPAERELFISGMCFDCQRSIFDEDEDDEENDDDEGFLMRWQSMFS